MTSTNSKPQATPAQDLLSRLRDAGVQVGIDDRGSDLRLKAAPGVLTADLITEVRKRKTAVLTILRAEVSVRRELQARYNQACDLQTSRYGGAEWRWTDRAMARIDESTEAVERAIGRADRATFDQALEEFAWRSTPIEVLLDMAGRGDGALDGWIGCLCEWVLRGCDDGMANDLVIEIANCKALGGRDLRVRVIGTPKDDEVSVEDLLGLRQAVEGGLVGDPLLAMLAGIATVRRSMGDGVVVTGYRRARG